jgi:hypothetical protein
MASGGPRQQASGARSSHGRTPARADDRPAGPVRVVLEAHPIGPGRALSGWEGRSPACASQVTRLRSLELEAEVRATVDVAHYLLDEAQRALEAAARGRGRYQPA